MILTIILFVIVIFYALKAKFSVKEKSNSNEKKLLIPNECKPIIIEDEKKRKNTISLKGRIKKVSKNINYNELFTSIEDIKPIDKKENLASNDNVLDLYTNLGFTENRNNNKLSDENRKPSANNPLPRSKDDLLFFDECHEKQEIDDNFEFLKDLKKDLIPQKVEQTKPIIEETSESDKIINRLRNNGSFSLTEISKFRKDSKQGMIN